MKHTLLVILMTFCVALGCGTVEPVHETEAYRQAYANGVWEAFIAIHTNNYGDPASIRAVEDCADIARSIDLTGYHAHRWPLIADKLTREMATACGFN